MTKFTGISPSENSNPQNDFLDMSLCGIIYLDMT